MDLVQKSFPVIQQHEICNQVTKAENISFGMGSLHGKGLNKRKKGKENPKGIASHNFEVDAV